MASGRVRRVQDAVHGLMEFTGVESVVIDVLRTPELQRLRRIRQLGLGYLVFPGAEHSRLVHSLGAAFLGLRFGKHLQDTSRGVLADLLSPKEASIRDLAVAALCHDLGHGPLSHAWERGIVGAGFPRDAWITTLGLDNEADLLVGRKWHEIIGHALLAWEDGQLHKLLEQHEQGFSERVRRLLRGEYYLGYWPRLLSSDIDVDRADFIIRDAYQSGVAYGRYDLDWLISTSTFGWKDGEIVVGFDHRKATKVVEQFLVARSALYDTVYHHKTVRAAEGMVELFLRRCRDVSRDSSLPRLEFINPVVRILSGETLAPHEVLRLDDYMLWVFITEMSEQPQADATARDLAGRIVSRDLFKSVPADSSQVQAMIERADGYQRMFKAIRPFVAGDPEYYLYLDRVDFSWFSTEDRETGYLVRADGAAEAFRQCEALQHFPQQSQSALRLFTVRDAVQPLAQLFQ